MDRRAFIGSLTGSLLAASLAADKLERVLQGSPSPLVELFAGVVLVAVGALSGCVVVPAEPPYVGHVPAPVVIGPPVVIAPASYYCCYHYPYGYGYGYHYGYRRW